MLGRHLNALRATSLVVALFAVTINFLQPLAHAAAMRDGDPQALWSKFCNPADDQGTPTEQTKHECCLGLVHAAGLIAPSSLFLLVEPVVATVAPSLPADTTTSVAIRDGPSRPRGPPLLA